MTEQEYQELQNRRSRHMLDDVKLNAGPMMSVPPIPTPALESVRPVKSKYGNSKVEIGGEKFDSKKEFARYQQLSMLQGARKISGLTRQVVYELIPAVYLDGRKQRPVRYIADFVYNEGGETVVEDTKGFKTPEYKLKRKMMKYILGIEVKET